MTNRSALINAFLRGTEWENAEQSPLAGDASNRRYLRLHMNGLSAVVMDAPPEKGEDVRPFVKIAEYLRGTGLSAPKIIASDLKHGILLLEDLGDDLFARVVAAVPSLEPPLYEAATDVLVTLHAAKPPEELPPYEPGFMAEMAALSYRWYRRGADLPFEQQAASFQKMFEEILRTHCAQCTVLIQRDYHAENLLWLPARHGVARVGLLDFQDAMLGHPAYDLVSLLQDARRDVPARVEQDMVDRYLQETNLEREPFTTAYAVLGAQRNLRILGVFARLCMHAGKPHYVDFIPRVWDYLLRDLDHPAMRPVRQILLDELPPPTPDLLKKLKDKCATIPTL